MTQTVVAENSFVHVAEQHTNQSGTFLVYAEAPAGYVPISGGLYSNNLTTAILESYPDYSTNRWYVRAHTLGSITVTAHAVCVKE